MSPRLFDCILRGIRRGTQDFPSLFCLGCWVGRGGNTPLDPGWLDCFPVGKRTGPEQIFLGCELVMFSFVFLPPSVTEWNNGFQRELGGDIVNFGVSGSIRRSRDVPSGGDVQDSLRCLLVCVLQ